MLYTQQSQVSKRFVTRNYIGRSIIQFCLLVISIGTAACGGGPSSSNTPPPQQVTVSVTSSSASVLLGNTQQFTATVTGISNTAVNWSINNVVGGNATVGTISASGLYTAPIDLPNPTSVTVQATSQADSSASGNASITITSDLAVTVATNPVAATSVHTSATLQFISTVSSAGHPDAAVTWSVNNTIGGSSAAGTISKTGLYTAPATVPTPFTVTITATSTADPSKTGNANVVVAGTIATISQAITAAQGGTLTLPDGSSVIIPPGVLASDQTVTLSEVSALAQQPPNQLIGGVGPGLVLSFAVPQPAAVGQGPAGFIARAAQAQSPSNAPDLQFSVVVGQNTVTGLQGSAPIADLVDTSGHHNFISAQGAYHSFTNAAQVAVSSSFLAGASSLAISMANWVIGASPQGGQRVLNGTNWGSYSSCPMGPKVLVLVHGMLSSVEGAFPGACAADIGTSGNYNQVLGYDYDWTQDINQSGSQLGSFLNTLAACPGVNQIDIEAHSEGVPVSISAATQATQASQAQSKISNSNFVFLGGPIMGTPVAGFPQGLLTALLNFPGLFIPPGSSLQSTPGAPFLTGMLPGSSEMATNRQNFANLLPHATVIAVGGTVPDFPSGATRLLSILFPTTPFDDVIGLSSALPQNSGLPNLTPLSAFPIGHTQLECDQNVVKAVGQAVQNTIPLEVNPAQLTFTAPQGGPNPPSQSLSLSTSGTSSNWTAVASAVWLSISPAAGTTPSTAAVSVNVTGLTGGTYQGNVTFTANNTPFAIPVTLIITPSMIFSGTLSGTNVDQGGGGCSGTASMSGTATMTLTAVTGGGFNITGQWTMTQSAGICDDYSGTYAITGAVDASGNVSFSTSLASGNGTLTGTSISGAWYFSAGPGPDVASGTFVLTAQ